MAMTVLALQSLGIDLAVDAAAARYVKSETVTVAFAREAGELLSLEGLNRYQPGDALITGSTGSRWSVSRERFDAKYEPLPPNRPGEDGPYVSRPVPVLAKRIDQAFTMTRSAGGDLLRGAAGDWLLQYAPGDFGVCEQQRFAAIYRRLD
jgi:hypothetical protein